MKDRAVSLAVIGSLVVPYGLGFPLVLSMRGALGERNLAQMALGRSAVPMLELLGIQAFRLRRPEQRTEQVRQDRHADHGGREAAEGQTAPAEEAPAAEDVVRLRGCHAATPRSTRSPPR